MRIGLSSAAYYGRLETDDAAAHIATLGVPCCEVFLETYSEYSPTFAQLLRARLGDVQVVSIHSKTQHFESDIFGQSVRQRADAFAMMESFLRAGNVLGAQVFVYHGPASIRGSRPNYAAWHDAIERAQAMALRNGITFAWETVSWCHLNDPDRVQAFLREWPTMAFVLDTKQVFQMGQDLLEYVDRMGEHLRHVHILDYDADGRLVLPGKGVHDFRAFARALRENGYDGDVILEPYASTVPSEPALLESIQWLRDTFQAE